MFPAGTYLTGTHSTLKRVCAHLIFPYATSEVFVAFIVTDDRHMCNIEDSFISSPWNKTNVWKSDKKATARSMIWKGG